MKAKPKRKPLSPVEVSALLAGGKQLPKTTARTEKIVADAIASVRRRRRQRD